MIFFPSYIDQVHYVIHHILYLCLSTTFKFQSNSCTINCMITVHSHKISITLQVDINGHITFSDIPIIIGSEFSPRPLESIRLPRVAPLWIDLLAPANGNVYYRVLDSTRDNDQTTLASISQQSSAAETISNISFDVKWALLVTWDHVAYYRNHTAVSRCILCLHY